jgi:hypothetical protein
MCLRFWDFSEQQPAVFTSKICFYCVLLKNFLKSSEEIYVGGSVMRLTRHMSCVLALAATSMVGCSGAGLVNVGGGQTSSDPNFTNGNGTIDFVKDCGIPQANLDDSSLPLVKGHFRSVPITVTGTSMGAGYRVVTQAEVTFETTSTGTQQDQKVFVLDSDASGLGLFDFIARAITESRADDAADNASGSSTSTGLPTKDWFKLTDPSSTEYTEYPDYKTLLCATSGTKSVNLNFGDGSSTITFSPAAVTAVSPLAPIARMRAEFGTSKSLPITAVVEGGGHGTRPGTYTGRIVIREVPVSTLEDALRSSTTPLAVPANFSARIGATIAWEIVANFDYPARGAYDVGLAKRKVFFIDTTSKRIVAIINEDDRPDATSGVPLPAVILLNVN